MRISVIGAGYVGAVTGICLAEMGHQVLLVDNDLTKIDQIDSGKSPIFEPNLEDLLVKNKKRIRTASEISHAILNSTLTLICVGTPQKNDGSSDLRYVIAASREIGASLKNTPEYHTVVVKSTVLPGTCEHTIQPVLEQESGMKAGHDFGLASNPEFLREGCAVWDFFHPDRVIIGTADQKSGKILNSMYIPLNVPIFITDIRTAEMIKYVSNAFLATKVSFSNEIGNLCKLTGTDAFAVFNGVGMDKRIGPQFFRSGLGYGGSCFPKDTRALATFSESVGLDPIILKAVIRTNDEQPEKIIPLLKKHMVIQGKTIGLLGLAFKPDTDDVRESRAIPVVISLIDEGAKVLVFDPVAMPAFQKLFPHISYAKSAEDILLSDAVVIITEWDEFSHLDYHGKIVVDGRRIQKAMDEAKIYEGICW